MRLPRVLSMRRPPMPETQSLHRPITTTGQLLVEGRLAEMFFREMIDACGLTNLVELRTFGDISKDSLRSYLELFTQKAAFKEQAKRLGIIRGAETQPAIGAFQSVQSALREAVLRRHSFGDRRLHPA